METPCALWARVPGSLRLRGGTRVQFPAVAVSELCDRRGTTTPKSSSFFTSLQQNETPESLPNRSAGRIPAWKIRRNVLFLSQKLSPQPSFHFQVKSVFAAIFFRCKISERSPFLRGRQRASQAPGLGGLQRRGAGPLGPPPLSHFGLLHTQGWRVQDTARDPAHGSTRRRGGRVRSCRLCAGVGREPGESCPAARVSSPQVTTGVRCATSSWPPAVRAVRRSPRAARSPGQLPVVQSLSCGLPGSPRFPNVPNPAGRCWRARGLRRQFQLFWTRLQEGTVGLSAGSNVQAEREGSLLSDTLTWVSGARFGGSTSEVRERSRRRPRAPRAWAQASSQSASPPPARLQLLGGTLWVGVCTWPEGQERGSRVFSSDGEPWAPRNRCPDSFSCALSSGGRLALLKDESSLQVGGEQAERADTRSSFQQRCVCLSMCVHACSTRSLCRCGVLCLASAGSAPCPVLTSFSSIALFHRTVLMQVFRVYLLRSISSAAQAGESWWPWQADVELTPSGSLRISLLFFLSSQTSASNVYYIFPNQRYIPIFTEWFSSVSNN